MKLVAELIPHPVGDLKAVYVCIKHFQKEDIDFTFKVSKEDGTFTEVPRAREANAVEGTDQVYSLAVQPSTLIYEKDSLVIR